MFFYLINEKTIKILHILSFMLKFYLVIFYESNFQLVNKVNKKNIMVDKIYYNNYLLFYMPFI